jgi:hypothetical protein
MAAVRVTLGSLVLWGGLDGRAIVYRAVVRLGEQVERFLKARDAALDYGPI